MQPFKWTKAHAVFLPEVDAEHRNLFRLAEELHHAVEAGADAAHIQNHVQSLVAGIEEHFAHEERLMRSAGCASYGWHKQQHDAARKKAKQFAARIAAGDAEAPHTLLEYLGRWLKDHMSLTDRMMGAQIRNHVRLAAAS
jgi:hemerythrin